VLFPVINPHLDVVNLPNGMPVLFEGQVYKLGGITFRDRPEGHPPGSSSPQWVHTMVVGTDLDLARQTAAEAGIGADSDPACTGSSKQATLLIAREGRVDEIADVHVLVTAARYDLAAEGKPSHIATAATASLDPLDPDPGEPNADEKSAAWRAMSDFCEALFRNFPPA
jgi:hypothetical protein